MPVIYDREVNPGVGSFVELDCRNVGEKLLPGTPAHGDWPGSEFRYPCPGTGGSAAVNVKVTGYTLQRRMGRLWARVRVWFVGDGEADTFTSGWMLVE